MEKYSGPVNVFSYGNLLSLVTPEGSFITSDGSKGDHPKVWSPNHDGSLPEELLAYCRQNDLEIQNINLYN